MAQKSPDSRLDLRPLGRCQQPARERQNAPVEGLLEFCWRFIVGLWDGLAMNKFKRATLTITSVFALTVGAATAAHADGDVTWQSAYTGLCLASIDNNWGNPSNVAMRGCGNAGTTFHEQDLGDGTWLMRTTSDQDFCLTAYSDHDVYMEHCSGNIWQRWSEEWDGGRGVWRLKHAATQWYITDYDNGLQIGVDPLNSPDSRQWWH